MTAAAGLDLGGSGLRRSAVTARSATRVAGARPVAPGAGALAARRRATLALVAPLRADVSRVPFVAVVVSLLAAGLLGLLMLNTVLAQGSFALFNLRADARVLADREQALLREVEALRSPEALAAKATDLGMVQSGQPTFLRLPDGAILGADVPAELPESVADGEASGGEASDEDESAETVAAESSDEQDQDGAAEDGVVEDEVDG